MRIDGLGENKRILMERAFRENKKEVEITGTKFQIREPNFCGGTIDSNCKIFDSEDLDIINCFDINKLEKMQKDLIYLNNLIEMRKKEINSIKFKYKLIKNEHTENRKKMITLYIEKVTYRTDIYNDKYFIKDETVEELTVNNIKSNQEIIINKLNEWKEKYNINLT